MTKQHGFMLGIGGLAISVASEDHNPAVAMDDAYRPFISKNGHAADVKLRVRHGSVPRYRACEKAFETGSVWRMFRNRDAYVIKAPPVTAILRSDFTSGEIFVRNTTGEPVFPLRYPLGEIIMINLLARERGMLVHACGVKHGGKGMLFSGVSGAGKSTMAGLWRSRKADILNDDRIIIRKINKRFWIYGTPWHGKAKVLSPGKAPLEKIFFLRPAGKNVINRLGAGEAVSRLMVCSFPTFWDKKGMEFTLNFCAELVEKIPCYDLGFVPDETVMELVK
jgi:hypothetical protein